jgi:hypothetical protein
MTKDVSPPGRANLDWESVSSAFLGTGEAMGFWCVCGSV